MEPEESSREFVCLFFFSFAKSNSVLSLNVIRSNETLRRPRCDRVCITELEPSVQVLPKPFQARFSDAPSFRTTDQQRRGGADPRDRPPGMGFGKEKLCSPMCERRREKSGIPPDGAEEDRPPLCFPTVSPSLVWSGPLSRGAGARAPHGRARRVVRTRRYIYIYIIYTVEAYSL